MTRIRHTSKDSKSSAKNNFPVEHYSYSSLVLFGTNPIMFKIKYINRQTIDSTYGISSIIGTAFHKAMETYYGGNEDMVVATESEAIEYGLKVGMSFIENYNDGWIKWTDGIPNKQKAQETFAFIFNSYVKEMPYNNGDEMVSTEEKLEEMVSVEWKGKLVTLPIKLKGYTDKIIRSNGKIKIVDYKTVTSFSNPEKIDGEKMIQAIQYYFLVYAKYEVEPYSFIFEEVKKTKNRDGGPQVKKYEIVYDENEQFFDFYFRYYEDVTKALNGEQVYVPNTKAMYDGDVSIISYIHRLDDEGEVAKQMKELKVENITDLLKKKIQSASSMKKFLATVEKEFISAKNLNYLKMKNEEKIQTKLMEHGMMIQFDSLIQGQAFDLYRYTPSIGLKMKKLEGYSADVEQVLGTSGIRVLAPIPDSSFVGFEVPKKERTFPDGTAENEGYNLAIGVDVMGKPYRFDMTLAPHMLVAGATGSGKSVFLNSLITQLTKVPDTEIHLYDPKIVELAHFKKSPNVVEYQRDPEGINTALQELVYEMRQRYNQLEKRGVKNITEYNEDEITKAPKYQKPMRRKFVIFDEFGDVTAREIKINGVNISKEIKESILILSQEARAAGIHLIIATQRPSVNIINGTIKSNFPTKAVFRTSKAVDSQVVLDETGAEKLLGMGDMIFSSNAGTLRLQGYRS